MSRARNIRARASRAGLDIKQSRNGENAAATYVIFDRFTGSQLMTVQGLGRVDTFLHGYECGIRTATHALEKNLKIIAEWG